MAMACRRHLENALGILRGDWGNSLVTRQPVLKMIGERLPNTLLLMLLARIPDYYPVAWPLVCILHCIPIHCSIIWSQGYPL